MFVYGIIYKTFPLLHSTSISCQCRHRLRFPEGQLPSTRIELAHTKNNDKTTNPKGKSSREIESPTIGKLHTATHLSNRSYYGGRANKHHTAFRMNARRHANQDFVIRAHCSHRKPVAISCIARAQTDPELSILDAREQIDRVDLPVAAWRMQSWLLSGSRAVLILVRPFPETKGM